MVHQQLGADGDAGHMLTDAAALGLRCLHRGSLPGLRPPKRPTDSKRNPGGFGERVTLVRSRLLFSTKPTSDC
jgi:hypothetical protein